MAPRLPKVGAQYRINGLSAEIIHVDNELVTLRHLIYRTTFYYRYDQFLTELDNRNIIELASAPGEGSKALAFLNNDDPQVVEAKRKFCYVSKALDALGGRLPVESTKRLIEAIRDQLNDPHPPRYNTLYKWIRIYKEHNFDRFSLLKNKSRLPRGRQLEAEVAEVIDQFIKDYYLTTQCISQAHVFAFIDAHIISINRNRNSYSERLLSRPSISSVRRRIKQLCQHTVDLARHGRDYAKTKHHYSRCLPEPGEVLHLAEIDSHRLKTQIVDENGNLLNIPAWIVVIFEVKTRMVIGWELSLTPPCAEKSVRAMKSAVLYVPGDECRRGKMLYLLSDNGVEFKNLWFASFADHLGIIEGYAPPRSPNARARSERWFKTFESWLQTQPGSTSSSATDRCDHVPDKQPFFTIEKAAHYFGQWLETVYHSTPHRTLKKPPLAAWEQAMKNRPPPEKFTQDALEKLSRKVHYAKIIHGRVQCLCLSWTGANLPELGARLNGKKAICYIDPGNLGTVWVADPADPHNPVRAEATNPDYQNGLTLTEHEKLKAAEKADALKYDFATPHLALWQLRQEIDQDYLSRLRTKGAKRTLTPPFSIPTKSTAFEPPPPNIPRLAGAILNLPVDHL
ncbi:DDE-type integrase/transposase/recombinase [Pseudomonas fluorescens]|uniref:DDE-type integrase/transposase/recombinase n=1 Tax=Pseudomonas fluorescens TaxID=294 RepID=UPI001A9F9FA9|nr:DDE-type integrase/transposase/recombinase [Pseudomonas fluorescens]QTD31736.1 transposase family protein [Pseudomonas fluorescens]